MTAGSQWEGNSDDLVRAGRDGRIEPTRRQLIERNERVVVAAALQDERGRVLVAQRAYPAHLAGRWEMPGGKTEPGEDDLAALSREWREELGLDIVPGERLGGDWPIDDGYVLRLWLARPASAGQAPHPHEHAALDWVEPEALHEVAWLPSDLPVAAELQGRLLGEEERQLAGGNVAGAVRFGRTVRRASGPWTLAAHAYMRHVIARGVPGVPRPLGIDDRGREVVEYLPGDVTPRGPWAAWALTDRFLTDIGTWLARLHAAAVDFPADGLRFRVATARPYPGELVCHNDVGPHNLVGRDGRLAGVVDWDVVGPAEPVSDVAYAAWGFALGEVDEPVAPRAHRLAVLARAYGADPYTVLDAVEPRITWMADVVRAAAAAGDQGMRDLLARGEIDRQLAAVAAFRTQRSAVATGLAAG